MAKRNGFTVLELVVVLMLGVALTSIAVRSMAGIQSRMSVRQARNVYAALHARARAQAVEFGEPVMVGIDAEGDSLWLERDDGTRLEVIRLFDEMGVDLQGSSSTYTVCMNARGFADESCNSFDEPVTLSFVMGGDSASLLILPLGQVIY